MRLAAVIAQAVFWIGAAPWPATVPTSSRPSASRATWPPPELVTACGIAAEDLARRSRNRLFIVVDPPFVVARDRNGPELDATIRRTIRPAAGVLWRQYFDRRPDRPVTILLFSGPGPYTRYAEQLFGDRDVSHFGYYRPAEQALVMDIETGTGTLVHEMVHALAHFDFPDMPAWFGEGLASLYEHCTIGQDRLIGQVNWRLPALQEAVRAGRLRPLRELMTAPDFRGAGAALDYAQARYFCMFLQERGMLRDYYRRLRATRAEDRTGILAAEAVSGGRPIEAIERDFLEWVRSLRYPG